MHPQLGNLSSRTNKKGKKFCSVGWINNENWGLNSRAELCHSLLICLWETLFKPERPQANILPYLSLYFCPSPASLFYTSLASSITSCLLWNLIHIKVQRSWYWRMVSGISKSRFRRHKALVRTLRRYPQWTLFWGRCIEVVLPGLHRMLTAQHDCSSEYRLWV